MGGTRPPDPEIPVIYRISAVNYFALPFPLLFPTLPPLTRPDAGIPCTATTHPTPRGELTRDIDDRPTLFPSSNHHL